MSESASDDSNRNSGVQLHIADVPALPASLPPHVPTPPPQKAFPPPRPIKPPTPPIRPSVIITPATMAPPLPSSLPDSATPPLLLSPSPSSSTATPVFSASPAASQRRPASQSFVRKLPSPPLPKPNTPSSMSQRLPLSHAVRPPNKPHAPSLSLATTPSNASTNINNTASFSASPSASTLTLAPTPPFPLLSSSSPPLSTKGVLKPSASESGMSPKPVQDASPSAVPAYWVTLFAVDENDDSEPVKSLLELDIPSLKLILTLVKFRRRSAMSYDMHLCSIFNQGGSFDLVRVDTLFEVGVREGHAQHVLQIKLPAPSSSQYVLFEDDESLRDFLKMWPKHSVLRATAGTLTVRDLKPELEEKGITSSHHAFELTLDMMLGIRTAVSKIEARAREDLTMQDMLTVTRLKFPSKGSRHTPAHGASDFYFKDYHPEVFRRIRSLAGIDPGKYLLEVCGDFEFLEFQSNSKSGEFFFFTHNRHYMIKTISHQEACILSTMLPSYYIHLLNNPDSLLIHFYGMHKVRPANQTKPYYFLIMRSIFHTDLPIHAIFDLKGSSLGRAASKADKASGNCVYKDNDFLEQKVSLQLPPDAARRLANAVERDVAILRDMNIMDYSLLIGIHYRADHPKNREGHRQPSISLNQISSMRLADPEGDSDEYEQHVSHSVRPGDLGFASLDTSAMLAPLSLEDVDEPDPQELLPKVPLTPLQRAHSALLIQNEAAAITKKPEPPIVQKAIAKSSEEAKKIDKKNPKHTLVTPASDRSVIDSLWRQDHGGCPGSGFFGDHEVYFMGIIDILVEYGMKKKLETKFKSLKHDKAAISSVDPHYYSSRFNTFIKSHVVDLT